MADQGHRLTEPFELGGHQLSRVPSGYDKDHPRADLLRYKTLTAHREYGAPDWLPTPKGLGYSLTFRFYRAKGAVEKRTYFPPPLVKQ